MLHASAEAMAEILGIAPTPSPSVSGYSTPTSLPATISSQPALASQPVIAEAAVSDKDTDKLKRKAEKKAAKAIEASRSDTQSDTTGAEGKERKKKRKREV